MEEVKKNLDRTDSGMQVNEQSAPKDAVITGRQLLGFLDQLKDSQEKPDKKRMIVVLSNGAEYFLVSQNTYDSETLADWLESFKDNPDPVYRRAAADFGITAVRLSRNGVLDGRVFIEAYRNLFKQIQTNSHTALKYLQFTNYLIRKMTEAASYGPNVLYFALMNAFNCSAYVTNPEAEEDLPSSKVIFSCLPRPFDNSQETLLSYLLYLEICRQIGITPFDNGVPEPIRQYCTAQLEQA